MKLRPIIIVFLIFGSLFLDPPALASAPSLSEEGVDEMSRLVARAISLVSSDRDQPLMPPVDATSTIRMIREGSVDSKEPTRTDPIPLNWDLAATFTHSRIYVEEGLYVPAGDIDAIGEIFDSRIYPNATRWFHPSNPYAIIDIRIYDFGDGPGNVGGFFFASWATRDHMYVDSEDLKHSRDWTFEIVAHEFQHLLHYDLDSNEDVWLNEGLADLSVRICIGPGTEGVQSHIEAYELYPENDLLLWNEGEPPDNIQTIADYGRAYAFVSYLAHHYGGKDFINDLVSDTRNSISSINAQLAENGHIDRFGDIIRKESVSNVFDDESYGGGIYYQGLIEIGIMTYEKSDAYYPSSHTITSTVRYSPYVMKYTSPTGLMGVHINSTSAVEGTMIGVSGDVMVDSINFTNGGGGSFRHQVSGFGTKYDTLYILPHTSSLGSSIDVSVEPSNLEPPVTEIMVSPTEPDGENGYYTTSPGIQLRSETATRIMYAFDDDPFREYSSAIHPPEGTTLLRFYSEGSLGMVEEERQVLFKVDLTDPFTEMRIHPEEPDGQNGYYITQPTINLTTDDDAISYYDLGDGTIEYIGEFVIHSGRWELDYWSVDRSGRTSELSMIEILVNLIDPEITYVIEPESPDGNDGYYITEPLVTLHPEGASVGYYSVNGGEWVEYTSPFYLEDGEYEMEVIAIDPSGIRSSAGREFIKVDTIEPDLFFQFSQPPGDGWISTPTYLTLSSEDHLADIFFNIADEGPFIYTSDILLSDGDYEVEFWAEDPAGNIASGGSRRIRIDTNPPSTTMILDRYPDNGPWFHDNPPGISFETASEPVSPETTYFSLDGVDFIKYNGQDIDLEPGINTIHFYSTDLAENSEEIKSRDIGLDLGVPVPVLSSNRTLIPVRGDVLFSTSGSFDDNAIYRFRLDFGDGSVSEWIYENTTLHHYSSLGDHEITIIMEDIAGREVIIEGIMVIEVLTQKEYDRRLSDDDMSLLGVTVAALIILAVIMVIILFIIVRRKRDSADRVVIAEIEWEEETDS